MELEKSVTLPIKLHTQKDDITDVLYSDTENEQDSDDNFHSETEETIHALYNICCKTGLNYVFPALYIALSIALTLPTSSASPERAFSKSNQNTSLFTSLFCIRGWWSI